MTRILLVLILSCVAVLARAQNADEAAQREKRWTDLAMVLFDGRALTPADHLIDIDAPNRAEDAALVPVRVTLSQPGAVEALWLVIDDNPSPLAAHMIFGPGVDARNLSFRVRVDSYSFIHVVIATAEGLRVAQKFIKASGGCSAPMDADEDAARKTMGEMRLKWGKRQDGATAVKLMIRHPNFNGMQMNQLTRLYTPADYIETISLRQGETKIFDLDGGISLSSDPVLGFGVRLSGAAPIEATVTDSLKNVWTQEFAPPSTGE